MLEKIVEFAMKYGAREGIFFLSMLPIFELRASIPLALTLGLHPLTSFVIPFIGSLVPVPFLLYFLEEILESFPKGISWINKLKVKFIKRAEKKSLKVERLGYLGLLLFVMLPIPGTGVWTGTVIASLLGMAKKKALCTIILGNFIAGLFVYLISTNLLII